MTTRMCECENNMTNISNNKDDPDIRDQSKSLKIAETNSKFVGKGMALSRPKGNGNDESITWKCY